MCHETTSKYLFSTKWPTLRSINTFNGRLFFLEIIFINLNKILAKWFWPWSWPRYWSRQHSICSKFHFLRNFFAWWSHNPLFTFVCSYPTSKRISQIINLYFHGLNIHQIQLLAILFFRKSFRLNKSNFKHFIVIFKSLWWLSRWWP